MPPYRWKKITGLTNQMLARQRRGLRIGRDVCEVYYNLHHGVVIVGITFASEEVMKFLMPLRKIAPKSIFGRVSRCSNIKNIGLLIVNLSADSFLLFFCCITSYENILKLNYIFFERGSRGSQRRKLVDCDKVMKVLSSDYLFSWKTLCLTSSGFISLYIHLMLYLHL